MQSGSAAGLSALARQEKFRAGGELRSAPRRRPPGAVQRRGGRRVRRVDAELLEFLTSVRPKKRKSPDEQETEQGGKRIALSQAAGSDFVFPNGGRSPFKNGGQGGSQASSSAGDAPEPRALAWDELRDTTSPNGGQPEPGAGSGFSPNGGQPEPGGSAPAAASDSRAAQHPAAAAAASAASARLRRRQDRRRGRDDDAPPAAASASGSARRRGWGTRRPGGGEHPRERGVGGDLRPVVAGRRRSAAAAAAEAAPLRSLSRGGRRGVDG